MNSSDTAIVWYKKPIIWGWFGTTMVVLIGIASANLPACSTDIWGNVSCVSKWTYVWSATPNELGDTLAGFAGALAFIWIIVTVAMQSLELAAQRVELNLTRKEFERMAVAQKDQVKLLAQQGAIFADEQRQRDEGQAENLLDENLRSLIAAVSDTLDQGIVWNFSNFPIEEEYAGLAQVISRCIGERSDEDLTLDDAITALRRRLAPLNESLWKLYHEYPFSREPERSNAIPQITGRIQTIRELHDSLSKPQRERLRRMKLDIIMSDLKTICETPKFWRDVSCID